MGDLKGIIENLKLSFEHQAQTVVFNMICQHKWVIFVLHLLRCVRSIWICAMYVCAEDNLLMMNVYQV